MLSSNVILKRINIFYIFYEVSGGFLYMKITKLITGGILVIMAIVVMFQFKFDSFIQALLGYADLGATASILLAIALLVAGAIYIICHSSTSVLPPIISFIILTLGGVMGIFNATRFPGLMLWSWAGIIIGLVMAVVTIVMDYFFEPAVDQYGNAHSNSYYDNNNSQQYPNNQSNNYNNPTNYGPMNNQPNQQPTGPQNYNANPQIPQQQSNTNNYQQPYPNDPNVPLNNNQAVTNTPNSSYNNPQQYPNNQPNNYNNPTNYGPMNNQAPQPSTPMPNNPANPTANQSYQQPNTNNYPPTQGPQSPTAVNQGPNPQTPLTASNNNGYPSNNRNNSEFNPTNPGVQPGYQPYPNAQPQSSYKRKFKTSDQNQVKNDYHYNSKG